MNRVVGLDRVPVKSLDLDMQASEAATALRALATKMESGQLTVQRWLFLYEERATEATIFTKSLDSGITLEAAVHMLEASKLDLLLRAREI